MRIAIVVSLLAVAVSGCVTPQPDRYHQPAGVFTPRDPYLRRDPDYLFERLLAAQDRIIETNRQRREEDISVAPWIQPVTVIEFR
jgi:hypothetical protein